MWRMASTGALPSPQPLPDWPELVLLLEDWLLTGKRAGLAGKLLLAAAAVLPWLGPMLLAAEQRWAGREEPVVVCGERREPGLWVEQGWTVVGRLLSEGWDLRPQREGLAAQLQLAEETSDTTRWEGPLRPKPITMQGYTSDSQLQITKKFTQNRKTNKKKKHHTKL